MPKSMRNRVLETLNEVGITTEEMDESGLFIIEITDDRARAHLASLPDFEKRCLSLSSAAVIGVLSIGASRPLEITVEIQERFNRLLEEFEGRTEEAIGHLLRELEVKEELEKEKRKQAFYAGDTFEQRIVSYLDTYADPRQDRVEYTGTTTDVGGKVGDIVYTLNLDGEWSRSVRIALEAKNRSCTRTGKKAFFLDEMDAGMTNRNCEYGIVVACLDKNSDDGIPKFPYLQIMPGKRFVVLVDEYLQVPIALEAVLQIIFKGEKARLDSGRFEIDADRINNALDKALNVTEKFRALKKLATSITSLESIREYIDEMENDVEGALREAQNEVKKSMKEQCD